MPVLHIHTQTYTHTHTTTHTHTNTHTHTHAHTHTHTHTHIHTYTQRRTARQQRLEPWARCPEVRVTLQQARSATSKQLGSATSLPSGRLHNSVAPAQDPTQAPRRPSRLRASRRA